MRPILCAYPFSAANLPEVQVFECGPDPWHLERAEWIKRPLDHGKSALNSIAKFNTSVWLYRNENGDLVGYGSLGKTVRPLPPKGKGKPEEVGFIPSLAIQSQFKHQPADVPREDRFAYRRKLYRKCPRLMVALPRDVAGTSDTIR